MAEFIKRAKAVKLDVDCLGAGKLDSEIVIIGEAPGEREAIMKMPFVGGSGKLLWDVLGKFDVNRTMCYCTNVVKRQVSLSSKEDAKNPVKRPELEHWEGLLDWELDNLPNVKYILALGNFALHALTGDTGITNWRGSVFDCKVGRKQRVVKVICSINPAHVMRQMNMEPMFMFDIAKLRRVMDGKFRGHKITPIINPSFEESIEYIGGLTRSDQPISFDIEVIANETACVGFANNAYEGICINFRDSSTNRYSIEEERILRSRIQQQLFLNPEKRFIAQNGSFDAGWLGYKDRIHVPKIWFDTLLAHHTLYPRMPHNLGFLTAQYTDHPYYKDEGKTWREGGNINQFWEYNVKDCCITWAVHEAISRELKAQDMDSFFFNHVMRLQPHLVNMQTTGVKSDEQLMLDIAKDLKQELDERKARLHDMIRTLTNNPDYPLTEKTLNSPTQMKKLFFKDLGLVGRGMSTGEDNRDRIKEHKDTTEDEIEFLTEYDKYKKEHKFYGTYATMRLDPDKRIRCEYKQFGTQEAPGRLSSSGTLWGSGTNLQNQPKRAYPMFICDDGYMFSYFDLKQAEAKVVAYIWNVQQLKENFIKAETQKGYDVHRLNAASIFQLPYDEIPEDDYLENGERSKRYLGKRCVHGLNYRMMPAKLAEVCSIPLWQAHEAFASYHKAFPEIQRGWQDTIDEVKRERMLFTPMGRRMIFLSRLQDDEMDSIIAFKPQSTIGDKVSECIYQCEEHPEWPVKHARIALNIHDALIALHKIEQSLTETVQGIMKECAETPIMIRGEPVQIFTDFKESVAGEDGVHRWSTLKDI